MLKKLVPLVLAASLSTHAYAAPAVYGVFSSDDSNIMTVSHDGDSIVSDCPSPEYGEMNTICTLTFKNKAGKTYAVKGLNADQISNTGIYWFPDHQAELVISPMGSNDLYYLIINFNTWRTYNFLNLIALSLSHQLFSIQNKLNPTEIVIANLNHPSLGLIFTQPSDAVEPTGTVQNDANALYQTASFDANGDLRLTYLTSNQPLKTKSVTIPINPSQFVPINPKDIGTFDLKTLNANSGNS